ncbi:MAG: hypothetical protein ABUS54_07675 [Actinomycetota bacterium]
MVNVAEYELADDVVWVGTLPGLVCRGAEQVRNRLAQVPTFSPEVLAERDGMVLIDPHVSAPPRLNPELHQILVVDDGIVSEIRDYPNLAAAQAAWEATA